MKIKLSFSVAACFAAAVSAQAQTFQEEYYYGGNDAGSVGAFTPGGPSIDYADIFNTSATANTITFDYPNTGYDYSFWITGPLSLAPTIVNGPAINLVSSGFDFTSVTIDAATTMNGFDSSDISFTDDQIQINWAGLVFYPNTIVELDYNIAATPEPSTIGLAGVGMAGLIAARRRKQIQINNQPPLPHAANRDSGTASANGGSLRRLGR